MTKEEVKRHAENALASAMKEFANYPSCMGTHEEMAKWIAGLLAQVGVSASVAYIVNVPRNPGDAAGVFMIHPRDIVAAVKFEVQVR